MLRVVIFLCLCMFSAGGIAEEEFIDIGDFLKERTRQYPLDTKVYLNTAPRTGSTLVYNILRFLFENEDHKGWSGMRKNLIVKAHNEHFLNKDGVYVVTIRDPIEACVSGYRVMSTFRKPVTAAQLDKIAKGQVEFMIYLDELIASGARVLVLRYEEFSGDFDGLLALIEREFSISIDDQDKCFLKKSLSKENVLANTAPFRSFTLYDDRSQIHGAHIDRNELTKELFDFARAQMIARLLPYADVFENWGYTIPLN